MIASRVPRKWLSYTYLYVVICEIMPGYNTYLRVVFFKILVVSQVHEAMSQAIVWKSKIDNSQGIENLG